jgi:hypothetical protein
VAYTSVHGARRWQTLSIVPLSTPSPEEFTRTYQIPWKGKKPLHHLAFLTPNLLSLVIEDDCCWTLAFFRLSNAEEIETTKHAYGLWEPYVCQLLERGRPPVTMGPCFQMATQCHFDLYVGGTIYYITVDDANLARGGQEVTVPFLSAALRYVESVTLSGQHTYAALGIGSVTSDIKVERGLTVTFYPLPLRSLRAEIAKRRLGHVSGTNNSPQPGFGIEHKVLRAPREGACSPKAIDFDEWTGIAAVTLGDHFRGHAVIINILRETDSVT